MAKMKPETPAYGADVEYEVTLAKPVTVRSMKLLPLHQHKIKGRMLNRIIEENGADVVDSATPVA